MKSKEARDGTGKRCEGRVEEDSMASGNEVARFVGACSVHWPGVGKELLQGGNAGSSTDARTTKS